MGLWRILARPPESVSLDFAMPLFPSKKPNFEDLTVKGDARSGTFTKGKVKARHVDSCAWLRSQGLLSPNKPLGLPVSCICVDPAMAPKGAQFQCIGL